MSSSQRMYDDAAAERGGAEPQHVPGTMSSGSLESGPPASLHFHTLTHNCCVHFQPEKKGSVSRVTRTPDDLELPWRYVVPFPAM